MNKKDQRSRKDRKDPEKGSKGLIDPEGPENLAESAICQAGQKNLARASSSAFRQLANYQFTFCDVGPTGSFSAIRQPLAPMRNIFDKARQDDPEII